MSAEHRPLAETRREEIGAALTEVRERIDAACVAAGRPPAEVRLLPVTKTFPADDVAILTDLGMTDFGENRDQEAGPKARELATLRRHAVAHWHMVGRLQRNKARSVVRWADVVHSVDSVRLADALGKAVRSAADAGERAATPLRVLVQVSLDDDPERGGCLIKDVAGVADHIAELDDLTLGGVMAVAPLGVDPAPAFERLAAVVERLRADHPGAREISAGMSGDLEDAIRYGSTCVRVGTALLGKRDLTSP